MAENLDKPVPDSAEKAYAAAAETIVATPVAEPAAPVAATPAVAETPAVVAPAVVAKAKPAAKPAANTPKAAKPVKAAKVTAKPVAAPKKAVAPRKPAVAKAPAAKTAPAIVKPAAKPSAKPINKTPPLTAPKETLMPAKKTTDFTATIKSVAADVQTKAKLVYAKGSELAGEAGDFTKGNVDAIVASGKILGAGMQDLGKGYVAEGKTALATIKADVKELTSVKSPVEFVRVQTAILRRNLDHAFDIGGKNSEAVIKLASDTIAPLTARAELAVAKFKKAA